jgi:hypothetical protein
MHSLHEIASRTDRRRPTVELREGCDGRGGGGYDPKSEATSGSNPMMTNSVVPMPKAGDGEGEEREWHGRTFQNDCICTLQASTIIADAFTCKRAL